MDSQLGRDRADLLVIADELLKPGDAPMGRFPDELTDDGLVEAMTEISSAWAESVYTFLDVLPGEDTRSRVPTVALLTVQNGEGPSQEGEPSPKQLEVVQWLHWMNAVISGVAKKKVMREQERMMDNIAIQEPRRPKETRKSRELKAIEENLQEQVKQQRAAEVREARNLVAAAEATIQALSQPPQETETASPPAAKPKDLGARPKEQRPKAKKYTQAVVSLLRDSALDKMARAHVKVAEASPSSPSPPPPPEPMETMPAPQTVLPVPPVAAAAVAEQSAKQQAPPPVPAVPAAAPKPLSYAKAAAKAPAAKAVAKASGAGTKGGAQGTVPPKEQQQQQRGGRPRDLGAIPP